MRAENAVLSEEEWMDGNNILLVVSASWKNYWFTANIHSLVLLSLLLFLFSSPPYHISIFPYCSPLSLLSVSVPLLFHTAPPMCTLTPNSRLWQRPGPRLQRPRPQSCDADLLCFTRLQCSEGASRGKGLRSPAAGNKAPFGRDLGECVCVRVWRLGGWGVGVLVWGGVRKQYFKGWNSPIKSLTSRSMRFSMGLCLNVLLRCCLPEMESL